MKNTKGFTLIELMIVIVIVAILASVVTPMLRSRVDRAKWSEAMAGCSSIATAYKAYCAENYSNAGAAAAAAIAGTRAHESRRGRDRRSPRYWCARRKGLHAAAGRS